MASRSPSISVPTLRSAVNGGHTTTSTASVSSLVSAQAVFWVSWTASRWFLCIFQLPAISGRRATGSAPWRHEWMVLAGMLLARIRGPGQHADAGQRPALEQLEAGATAGGQVVDLLREAELGEGGGRVAAADHRVGVGRCDRLGDGSGTGLEGRPFEHAHRAVPEDRPGAPHGGREGGSGGGADVQAPPPAVAAAGRHGAVLGVL